MSVNGATAENEPVAQNESIPPTGFAIGATAGDNTPQDDCDDNCGQDNVSQHAAGQLMEDDEFSTPLHDNGKPRSLCARLPPPSELYVFLVAVFCGVSIMLPTNAVFSAPSYIMNYYKYATHDADAVPQHPNFWNNCLTYYSLLSMAVALVMEPLTLTPWFRKVPILPRMHVGLIILMVEVIILMSVSAKGTSETGAVATICCAGLISGFGRSLFESTTYGLFSAFPHRFSSTMMGGVGVSGVLTSFIQIMVKAAIGDGYDNVITQSRIYYGLDVGIQCCTFTLVFFLRWNSFAADRVRGLPTAAPQDDGAINELAPHHDETACGGEEASPFGADVTAAEADKKDYPLATPTRQATKNPPVDAVASAASEVAPAPANDAQAAKPGVFATFKKIFWMFIACGFNFFVTLMLFPTVTVSADDEDYWYGTIAVFIFNVFDVFGRFSPSLKFLWPRTYKQRYLIVAGSFARAIFLPLLIMYSFHVIPGHIYGYIMMVIFGYSNGFIGTMALVLGPLSRGIETDRQRFISGTMMGISILIGGSLGMAASLTMQAARGM